MGKSLDFSLQLFKKGTVIFIPAVPFSTGVTKAKFAILLENADVLYKRRTITACLTTSRKFRRFKSWFVVTSAEILGKRKSEQTTIDCLNRIHLSEAQVKKCKFIGYLPQEILEEVEEANEYAEFYLKKSQGIE